MSVVTDSLLRELAVLRRLESFEIPGMSERIAKLTQKLPSLDATTSQRIAQKRKGYLQSKRLLNSRRLIKNLSLITRA